MNYVLGRIAATAVLSITAWLPEPPAKQNARPRTEVVLVGTIHHFAFLHPDNTPTHLRALLDRVRPDVIALENPPDWQAAGRHVWIHLPEFYIAEEYGRDHHIPVVGQAELPQLDCPWAQPAPTPNSRAQRFAEAANTLRDLGAWEALMAFGEESWAFAAAQDRIELERMDPYSRAGLADSGTIRAQDRMAARITSLAQQYAGRRLAVLFGSSQLYGTSVRLRKDPRISLIDVRKFLPTSSEVQAASRAADALLLLGADLDGWSVPNMPQARNHQRTRALLSGLQARDPQGTFANYYKAKWQILFGGYEDAARLLNQLIAAGPTTELPWPSNSEWSWPPWSSVLLKALFTRATLHDLMGEHPEARKLYNDLLLRVPAVQLRPRHRGPNTYYDLRAYLEDLAQEPYRGGPWEAFRIQESRRCWPANQVPGDAWPR